MANGSCATNHGEVVLMSINDYLNAGGSSIFSFCPAIRYKFGTGLCFNRRQGFQPLAGLPSPGFSLLSGVTF
jgi:hypothetical protein